MRLGCAVAGPWPAMHRTAKKVASESELAKPSHDLSLFVVERAVFSQFKLQIKITADVTLSGHASSVADQRPFRDGQTTCSTVRERNFDLSTQHEGAVGHVHGLNQASIFPAAALARIDAQRHDRIARCTLGMFVPLSSEPLG